MKRGVAVVANHLMFDGKNYFEIFSLPVDFIMNDDQLEARYLEFQKQFHPDSLIGKDVNNQFSFLSNSVLVNQAYQILKDPLKRAIYLLKLKGIDIDSENSAPKTNQEILADILELREKISGLLSPSDKEQIRKSVAWELKILLTEFKNEIDNLNYQAAAQKLIKAKYLDKVLIDLKSRR